MGLRDKRLAANFGCWKQRVCDADNFADLYFFQDKIIVIITYYFYKIEREVSG